MPEGIRNEAVAAGPSAIPAAPLPATVQTPACSTLCVEAGAAPPSKSASNAQEPRSRAVDHIARPYASTAEKPRLQAPIASGRLIR
jgi:hypothetical protein